MVWVFSELVAEVVTHIRSMHTFVASGCPTGAVLEEAGGMGTAANRQLIRCAKLLHVVAFHAEVRVAFGKHLLVHRSVRAVASNASLLSSVMREDEGASLLGMTLDAS